MRANAEIGEYTYGQPEIRTWGEPNGYCRIGKFCSIADQVFIFVGGNHRVDWVSTYPFNVFQDKFPNTQCAQNKGNPYSKGPVIIGNDVWLGRKVTIVSGVTIGDGSVVGAHSVVTKDIPPYCVAAGNPARVVKKRFLDEQIAKLLEIKWWNWTKEEIAANCHLLCSSQIDDFIQVAEQIQTGKRMLGNDANESRPSNTNNVQETP